MESRLLRNLKGKSIIDIQEGRRIGAFEDLLIAPGGFETLAIVTTKTLLFNRKLEALRAEDVRVWGRDVLLVASANVIHPREQIPGLEDALLASTVLRGRSAISTDGRRLGIVDDFYINSQGRLEAVHLSQTFADGPIGRMKMLPITAIRSLGPDVIIVDMDRMVFASPAEGTVDVGEGTAQASTGGYDDREAAYLAQQGDRAEREIDLPATLPTRPVDSAEPEYSGAMIFPDHDRGER